MKRKSFCFLTVYVRQVSDNLCILKGFPFENNNNNKKRVHVLYILKSTTGFHVWLSFPCLKCIVLNHTFFFFYDASYVFVVSPVSQYSLLSWCEPLCLNVHSVTLAGLFLKGKKNKKTQQIMAPTCLPLSKPLLLLKPSALIVRKLRVLVNNDQIYFFVFSLMTADIGQTTEVKLWIVIRY